MCQNYEQPRQTSQNSDFQSPFSVFKIDGIFPKKNSMKIIGLGDLLLIKIFFKILILKTLYFLKMCPIFVDSVHNFDRSDTDII